MKRLAFSSVACLGLLVTTAWLVATPSYAASITVSCGSGSLTCDGTSCQGSDSSGGNAGYCSCTKADGTNDTKTCSGDLLIE
jgi:hypothetical protein